MNDNPMDFSHGASAKSGNPLNLHERVDDEAIRRNDDADIPCSEFLPIVA